MEFEAGSRDEGELRPSLDAGAADSEAERDFPRDELRTWVQCHQAEESCIIDGLAPCKMIDQKEKQPNRADGNAGARGIGS